MDSSGNVYIVGRAYLGTYASWRLLVAKYNGSGTIQWQRTLDSTSFAEFGYDVAVDPSGNVYICGTKDTNHW